MESLEKTLIGLEEKSWQANVNEDVNYFREYTTDDLLVVASFGVFDKPALVVQMEKKQGATYKSARMENPRVMALTGDSALITYKVIIEATYQGKDMIFQRYVTTVYVKKNGVWKAAFMQQTDTR